MKCDPSEATDRERAHWNGARWTAGDPRGHYESWFQRANHPTRPLAFWIRYTIFSPAGRPGDGLGELWAIAFDGERGSIVAVKEEHSIRECRFAKSELEARIAGSTLDATRLRGGAKLGAHELRWDLAYTSPEPVLLTFDRALYGKPIPKAKALVGSPLAVYRGNLVVDGERLEVDGWVGSQNHNWGEKHTDQYAWGQVCGFDDAPDAFLEVGCGRIKVGPVLTPALTVLTLRLDGREHAFGTIGQGLRAKGSYDFFRFAFETGDDDVHIAGNIAAARADFVGLPYYNPPGGTKTCLNSKIARCDLTVRRRGEPPRTLSTRSRAAFEILTEATDHGVPVLDPKA
ncbi:MAG: hypothetical protein H6719_07585 [Sandaracinaceae bacterium]|nr:hypothetical protein [Sandaracinaceae bacterium]